MEGGGPAVVAQRLHGHFLPGAAVASAVQQQGGDLVVAIGENVGFDNNGVTDDALGGEATGVDFGLNVLDDNPRATLDAVHGGHTSCAARTRQDANQMP